MSPGKLLLLLLAFVSASIFAEQAEDLEKQGKELLRGSQSDQTKLVPAAQMFVQATAMYEAQGNTEKAVEMNSYLYWCKKKMNMDDINRYTKSAGVASAEKLQAVEKIEAKPDESQLWLNRVDDFARKYPEEHFLIAVRYFEVADRFKGTEISLRAQELSLQSMQKTAPKVNNIPPVEPPKPIIAGRLPVPAPVDVRKAEKSVAEIFGAETAKAAQGDFSAIAQKILASARTSNDEPSIQYVLYKLASETAARGSSVSLLMQSTEAMNRRFEIDLAAEKVAGLQKIPATTPEKATEVFCAAIQTIDEAKSTDSFDGMNSLLAVAQTAAARTNLAAARTLAARYSIHVKEIARDWPSVKSAWERWKVTPEDPALNLAIGKFYAFLIGDWNRGLAALARSNDQTLKALAEQELAPNNQAGVLMAIADQWWDYAEKQKGVSAAVIKVHAGDLYRANLEAASALTKIRAQKRLDSISKVALEIIGGKEDVSGVYAGDFPAWKAELAITPDGRFRKVNDGLGGSWTYSGIALTLKWDGFAPAILYQDTPGVFKGTKSSLILKPAKK